MNKGQITLFIILGLVLLLAIGSGLFLYSRIGSDESTETINQGLLAQFNAQNIAKDMVHTCLAQIVNEGISIIKYQGGFIEFPSRITKTLPMASNYEIYDILGTDGEYHKRVRKNRALIQVPYYVTVEDGFLAPSLEEVEFQLETYINKELKYCVDGLEPLEDEIKININEGTVISDVKIGKAVVVTGQYQIKGDNDDLQWEFKDFAYTVPVDVKRWIDYGRSLAIIHMMDHFLDFYIKDLISLYSYSGGSKRTYDLPPISYFETKNDQTIVQWSQSEASSKLKDIISSHIRRIRINDTYYDPRPSDHVFNYFQQDNFTSIKLKYDQKWSTEIDIEPKYGGLLKPYVSSQTNFGFLPFYNIDYIFKYDIKLPILFRLHDYWSVGIDENTKTVLGNGMDFYFAIESYICGNHPGKCNNVQATSAYNLDSLQNDLDIRFCENKKSNFLVFNTTNKVTKKPVGDIGIYYWCGSDENNCLIGYTDSEGILNARLPYCHNGIVYTGATGYCKSQAILSVDENMPYDVWVDLEVEPEKTLNVTFKGVDMLKLMYNSYITNNFNDRSCNGLNPLDAFEATTFNVPQGTDIIMDYKKDDKKQTIISSTMNQIKVCSGTYDLSTTVISNVSIYPTSYSDGNGGFFNVSYVSGDPQATYVGPWMMGSRRFSVDFPFTIHQKDNIIIYVPFDRYPGVHQVKDFEYNVKQENGAFVLDIYDVNDCVDNDISYHLLMQDFNRLMAPK